MENSKDEQIVLNDSTRKERDYIARMSKLSAVHWLAVLLSLLLTTGAWYFTSLQVQIRAEERFDRYADQVIRLVKERMEHYENTLASGVAAIQASGGDFTHSEWRQFTRSLKIETKYPGINGMGVIYRIDRFAAAAFIAQQRRTRPGFDIHPTHESDILYPITYIESEATNFRAIGLDMAHEQNRLEATLRARDTGRPQVTGPIYLVQDARKTPGFLFFMPYYRNGQSATLEQRQGNFVGMVYAPFVFRKLMKGVLGRENRLVHFAISDDGRDLYSDASEGSARHSPEFRKTYQVSLYGRDWNFEIWDTPRFQAANHSNEPTMILLGGIIIDALLFSLFVMLANSNKRALRFADLMTHEARHRAESLQRSNEDLERFAYVASHDLKTPLRGIGFLAECIREDIDLPTDQAAATELVENLNLLDDQVRHMDSLITGILTYSSVGTQVAKPKAVNISKLVRGICTAIGLQPHQYSLTGDKVDFKTDIVRLQQVLQNLIGNAHEYHPDADALEVTIDVQDKGERLEFTVTDNGAGIEARYHDKVFEMFQTLNTGKVAGGTGIGLAIVKKSVNLYGGEVHLNSAPGQGCSFYFDWPKILDTEEKVRVAA
ncbi:CHASE domain-containing protein [Roseovarius sp. CAU 1744]|uniref:sensor histidine kinase n=1 Tax=Roseovarius sp. CAU 1744 TaxID=3140368 RepID=UPI00325AD28A